MWSSGNAIATAPTLAGSRRGYVVAMVQTGDMGNT
jgi:hypothetical protein